MSTALPAAIVETIIGRLALLFLAGAQGNETAAREAAVQMLAAYQPESVDELRLAAQIISFGLHALETLSQATTPDLPLGRILRLRGSAVSLSRESHKAERRLQQLQKSRHSAHHAAITPPDSPTPEAEPLAAGIPSPTHAAAGNRGQAWSQAHRQREQARQMTQNLKRNQAAHLNAQTVASPPR